MFEIILLFLSFSQARYCHSFRPIHGTEKNIETKNPDSHQKARIRLKLSNKHSLSQQYECKTRKDTEYCITKHDQTKQKNLHQKTASEVLLQILYFHAFRSIHDKILTFSKTCHKNIPPS